MTTVNRPAPLPPRPGQAIPPSAAARKPLPAGAAAWSRTYLDGKNLPMSADHPVPVDADGHRTAHIRLTCRGHIEVDGVKQNCDHTAWALPGEKGRFCPDHGCPLTATDAAKSAPILPWAAIRKAVEPSARPLWVLLAELAAGIGEYAGHVPWWQPATAAPLIAGTAYFGAKRYLTGRAVKRGKVEEGQRDGRRMRTIDARARAAGYIAAGAGGWLTLAAATDPHTPVGKVAWCSLPLWYALSAPTWLRYVEGLKNRPEPAVEAPVAAPLVEVKRSADELSASEAAHTWDVEVAIAGTTLDPDMWRRIACGWQAVIVATKRGALNNLGGDNQKATIRRIAAAFDVPKSAVTWIEEHDDSPNKALLLVQPNNPLKDGQVWPGPRSVNMRRGVAEAGKLIDGTLMVERLYRYGWGAPSEIILGTTGSGKSERIRKRLVVERYASFADNTGVKRGAFISILHDPKRFEAYAEFRRAVHAYGMTRDDAHMIADALTREMFRRYDYLASLKWEDSKGRRREGGIAWNPLVHGPVISVFWDEFHELAGDQEFVKKLEKLARYQRACGMRATLASHMGTLGDTGSQALRDLLAGGRAVLLRTTSGLNAPLATGGQLTGDPRTLPKVPGMCYVSDGDTPTLMGRESFIPSGEDDDTLYNYLFDDDNNPIGFPADIPPETAEAFGREFMEWAEAGRRPGGREVAPMGAASGRVSTAEASRAEDALRQILFTSMTPLGRAQIAEHPLWAGRNVTSTLTKALKTGQEARPPWLRRLAQGNGLYELVAAERERMQAVADELVEVGQ